MIVVKLKGGLGNQMFQMAAAISFSLKWKKKLIIDTSFLESEIIETENFTPRSLELSCFEKFRNLEINNDNKFFRKHWKKFINDQNYQSNLFIDKLLLKYFELDDYFQGESFFIENQEKVLDFFRFDENNLSEENQLFKSKIDQNNSVSIHIRRGDYLKPEVQKYHGICEVDYYLTAIEYIKSKIKQPKFYIFSDDHIWVKKELLSYVDEGELIETSFLSPIWVDLYLMSRCKHNVIANSSYSWWGAWLNPNSSKIVISPKFWYANTERNKQKYDQLVPSNWIRL